MKNILLLLVFVLLIYSCNNSSKNISKTKQVTNLIDDYTSKIDSIIKTTNPRKFNGIILITKNGKKKYSKAFGYSNFEKKIPINIEDNFRIQSNSKQITAALILIEVEKGKIDLNSSIKEYLPNVNQSWADLVTIHQVLNMSSGIASINEPLLFNPGTDFHYSNPSYGLLRQIIEKINGKKFTEIANNLFEQLGMKNTYCYKINGVNNNLINGYNQSGKDFNLVDFNSLGFTIESWEDFIPAGGIISNVNDLHIWDSKLHNGKILNNTSYDLMTESNVSDFHEAFSHEKMLYGYGININEKKPINYVGHAGTGIGFANLKIYIPESKTNVIILENVFSNDMGVNYHFEKEIRKIVLESNLVK